MSLRNRHSVGSLLLLTAVSFLAAVGGVSAQDKAKQELMRLTYAQLGQYVHDNQGKVVYVDFWQFSCIPCKRSMPDLARLQQKYGPSGFVAVTVNMDDIKDAVSTQKSQEFVGREDLHLQSLTHFQLNETPDFLQNALGFNSVPRGYLFDRAGRLVHKSNEAIQYDELAKQVEKLLESK